MLAVADPGQDQALGNPPCCHPMLVEVTGPATGAAAKAGAVQLDWPVWAPNQVADPELRQTSQQIPSDEWAVRVTLPLDADAPVPPAASAPLMADPMDPLDGEAAPAPEAPSPVLVTAMLTVDALVVGPVTKETDGSEADSDPMSSEP